MKFELINSFNLTYLDNCPKIIPSFNGLYGVLVFGPLELKPAQTGRNPLHASHVGVDDVDDVDDVDVAKVFAEPQPKFSDPDICCRVMQSHPLPILQTGWLKIIFCGGTLPETDT